MAQSVGCLALDFSSGHDLSVVKSSLESGSALSEERLGIPSHPLPCLCSIFLSEKGGGCESYGRVNLFTRLYCMYWKKKSHTILSRLTWFKTSCCIEGQLWGVKILFIHSWEIERGRDTGRGRSGPHAGSLTWDSLPECPDHALGRRRHQITQPPGLPSTVFLNINFLIYCFSPVYAWHSAAF